MRESLAKVETFLRLLEHFETSPTAYHDVLHSEYSYTELPNLLTPRGGIRDLKSSMDALATAPKLLTSQRYEVLHVTGDDARLAVELLWTGKVRRDAGPLSEGQELKAHVCAVFEFSGGKIIRQRNYDCYEPAWPT